MPTHEGAEHRASYRSPVMEHEDQFANERTDHDAEDKTEHKTNYKTEESIEPNGDGKSTQFTDKFNAELRGIDDRAAAVFDPKGNIAEYTTEDRKSFVSAYVTAFNNTAPEDLTERWNAASETSNLLFQPLYEQVELREAHAHLNYNQDTLNALSEADVKAIHYITNTPMPYGTRVDYDDVKEIEFTVASLEEAKKIMEASNGDAYIVDPTALDLRKQEFAVMLYASSADPETTTAYMTKTLEDAVAYANGEQFEKPEPTDFKSLTEQKDEQVLYSIVQANIRATATDSRRALDYLSQTGDPDSAGAHGASEAYFDTYQQAMMQTIANDAEESFNKLSAKLGEFDHTFADAIREKAGFIMAEDYTQPKLPETFTTTDEALYYISDVGEALDKFDHRRGDLSPENYYAISKLASQFNGQLEYAQEEELYNHEDPTKEVNPAHLAETFRDLHKTAEAINFLMRPHLAEEREAVPA